MVMPSTFYKGTDWEQASGPRCIVQVHEDNVWPIADNSESGVKDALANGTHPVVAIGGRAVADGRPLNLTGVVVSFLAGLTTATGLAQINIADGMIVRQWVNNALTYNGGHAATWEQTPVPGQPVFVDDSHDCSEGVTLSMSPLNYAGLRNPLAGYLWWCQDEYADAMVGGSRSSPTFDLTLPNSKTEQEYCVLLVNHGRELA
jgi:hypothetical protein